MFEEKKKKKKRKKASGKDMLSGVAQVRSLSMFWLFSAPHALNQNGRFDGDCSLCKASTTRKKKKNCSSRLAAGLEDVPGADCSRVCLVGGKVWVLVL